MTDAESFEVGSCVYKVTVRCMKLYLDWHARANPANRQHSNAGDNDLTTHDNNSTARAKQYCTVNNMDCNPLFIALATFPIYTVNELVYCF